MLPTLCGPWHHTQTVELSSAWLGHAHEGTGGAEARIWSREQHWSEAGAVAVRFTVRAITQCCSHWPGKRQGKNGYVPDYSKLQPPRGYMLTPFAPPWGPAASTCFSAMTCCCLLSTLKCNGPSLWYGIVCVCLVGATSVAGEGCGTARIEKNHSFKTNAKLFEGRADEVIGPIKV